MISALLIGMCIGALISCSLTPDHIWVLNRRPYTAFVGINLIIGEFLHMIGY